MRAAGVCSDLKYVLMTEVGMVAIVQVLGRIPPNIIDRLCFSTNKPQTQSFHEIPKHNPHSLQLLGFKEART